MNTSAPLFIDNQQYSIIEKQKAELYMQIYQYAAEDFFTTQDAQGYHIQLSTYFMALEMQLTKLMAMLATHTHLIPPHIHPIAGPATCLPNVPQPTFPPVQSAGIVWTKLKPPEILYTTGTKPNLVANKVMVGTASEGNMTAGLRRALPIPITLTPTIPPVLSGTLKGTI